MDWFTTNAFAYAWRHIVIMAILQTGVTFLCYGLEKWFPFLFPIDTLFISGFTFFVTFLLPVRITAEKAYYDQGLLVILEVIGLVNTLRDFLNRDEISDDYVDLCTKLLSTIATEYWTDVTEDDADGLNPKLGSYALDMEHESSRDIITRLIANLDDIAKPTEDTQREIRLQTYLRSLENSGTYLDRALWNIAISASPILSDVARLALRVFGILLPLFFWAPYRFYTIPFCIVTYAFYAALEAVADIFSKPQRSNTDKYALVDVGGYVARLNDEFRRSKDLFESINEKRKQ